MFWFLAFFKFWYFFTKYFQKYFADPTEWKRTKGRPGPAGHSSKMTCRAGDDYYDCQDAQWKTTLSAGDDY